MSHAGPPSRSNPAHAQAGHASPNNTQGQYLADDQIDMQLAQRARQGQPGAWQELLARHQDRLYAVCVRMVGPTPRGREIAADLTQDALVKIIQGLHTFDGNSKLSTWMIRVTMNVVLSWQRGQKLRAHASLEQSRNQHPSNPQGSESDSRPISELLEAREPRADLRVQSSEARTIMAQALSQVEPEQRALLVLRDVRGLDYAEIAHVMSVPVGTIKSRLFRARVSLRDAYEKLANPHHEPHNPDKPQQSHPPRP